MQVTRRTVLGTVAGAAAGFAAGPLFAATQRRSLLILGGTGFVGPHLTELALARGWRVTHFNRGRRDADVEGVETLIGDRKGQLDALRDRRWAAVIDNTGYIPKYTRMSSDLLAPNAGFCLFTSSISAYASFTVPNDEDSPVGKPADPDGEDITNDTYGPMKALCEQYVRDAFGARSAIVRPGYIVGPLDATDRFTYWPVRFARGGEMAAPGTPADPIQVVDVRDLVNFMLDLVERRVTGTFNAVSAPGKLTMGTLLDSSRRVTGADTRVTWLPEAFLAQQLKPEEMRLDPWAPMDGEYAGASLTRTDRAEREGLRCRPLDETVRDTLAWHATRPAERQRELRSGLTPEREAALLAAWAARPAG